VYLYICGTCGRGLTGTLIVRCWPSFDYNLNTEKSPFSVGSLPLCLAASKATVMTRINIMKDRTPTAAQRVLSQGDHFEQQQYCSRTTL
jgi:hypothetical protein